MIQNLFRMPQYIRHREYVDASRTCSKGIVKHLANLEDYQGRAWAEKCPQDSQASGVIHDEPENLITDSYWLNPCRALTMSTVD